MNELELLENAAVGHMAWESNNLNAYGSMAFFGDGPPGDAQHPNPPGDLGQWFKEPKNLALLGMGALALILLIMLLRKD